MRKLLITLVALVFGFSAMCQNTFKEYSQIVALLQQHKTLSSDQYAHVVSYCQNLNMADLSESLGHELYVHFKKNDAANKQMLEISTNGNEKNLITLVEMMDVDLVSDEYTYEKLVADFPMFANNKSVEKRFFEVIDNE